MPEAMTERDNPVALDTLLTPPRPMARASVAAQSRRHSHAVPYGVPHLCSARHPPHFCSAVYSFERQGQNDSSMGSDRAPVNLEPPRFPLQINGHIV